MRIGIHIGIPFGVMAPNYLSTFVVEGDSRSAPTTAPGGAPTASPWPDQLRTLLPTLGGSTYVNAAVAGETVATMIGQYASQIAPYHSRSGSFVLMAGINDRTASSAATIATNIQTIVSSAKAGFGRTYVALENIRTMGSVLGDVNDILLSAQSSGNICNAFIAPHVLLPESADFLAADALHPSVAGNAKIAAFMQKLLTEQPESITPIDPATLASCEIAVDISDLSTLRNAGGSACSNGDTVATWNDRSGKGINLTDTLAAKPVYDTARPLKVKFNTVTANTLTTAGNFVKSAPLTIYGLIRDIKNAGVQGSWLRSNQAGIAPILYTNYGVPKFGTNAEIAPNRNCISHSVVHCAVFDGANSKYYIDGKLQWSGTVTNYATGNKLVIGGGPNGSTEAFQGDIGGISVHTGAHDHATIRAVSKWYSNLGKTYFYPFA